MNFVKRAFLYCFRQKVKTLILFFSVGNYFYISFDGSGNS